MSLFFSRYGLLGITLIVNMVFLAFASLQSWEPYDYSGMVDVAWRLARGQQIYVDFMFFTGPITPLGLALFFKLAGVSKYSIVLHTLTASSIFIVLIFNTFKRYLRFPELHLSLLLTMVTFYWGLPFPNYSQDAYLLGVAALCLVISRIDKPSTRFDLLIYFSVGFLAVLSCLTKLPIGCMFAAMFLLFFVISRNVLAGCMAVAGFTVAFLVFISLFDFHAYLENTFGYYALVSGRMYRFLDIVRYLQHPYFIYTMVAIISFRKHLLVNIRWVYLILGCAAVGFVGAFTGGANVSRMPLWKSLGIASMLGPLVGLVYILLNQAIANQKKVNQFLAIRVFLGIMTFILIASIAVINVKQTFRLMSPSPTILFSLDEPQGHSLQTKQLKGWHTPSSWGPDLDELIININQIVPQEDSLLALSPWELVYSLTGRESFKPFPLHVFPFAQDNSKLLKLESGFFLKDSPPKWIVTHVEPKSPQGILNRITYSFHLDEFILTNYSIVWHSTYAALFKLKES